MNIDYNRMFIKEAESHVIIFFLLLRFLLLGSCSWSSLGSSSGSSSSSSWGSSDSGPDLGDQVLQVTALKGLSEETWPVWFEFNSSRLEDGGDLLRCDGDVVIGEDEGGVDTGEFSGHGGTCASFLMDLAQREQGTRFLL